MLLADHMWVHFNLTLYNTTVGSERNKACKMQRVDKEHKEDKINSHIEHQTA